MTKQTPTTLTTPSRRRRFALSAGVALGSIGVIAGAGAGSVGAIVDGVDASISDNPWQVALTGSDGDAFCGGSIVSDRVIVTAAHCVEGTPESDVSIRAGATDLTTDDGQRRDVTKIIEHPKYVDGVGDIAMLVLDRPLELGGDVQAIPLATSADIAASDTARVSGWGVTSENGSSTPSVLQSTDVPLVSDADCGLIEAGSVDEMCAGGTGTDSCYGDSGGPLTVATNEGQALAGVVSWGDECGGESAGVYAEVPTFVEWVNERVADPDAPAGERLPAPEPGEFDDEFGDDADPGDVIDIDEDFIDQYDGDLDTMTDAEFDEFWDAYVEWLDEQGRAPEVAGDIGSSDDPVHDDSEVEDAPSASTSGDLLDDEALFELSDDEFDAYLDGLTDAQFDDLIERWEADGDVVVDTDIDFGDGDFDDSDFDDDDLGDADFGGSDLGNDVNGDDIVQWSEFLSVLGDDSDVLDGDRNGDGIVQWSELLG